MKALKKSIAFCVATSLITSSAAFASQAERLAKLQNMGPNQLINQGKTLLWENAYRIDKELIAYSESQSEQNFSSYTSDYSRKKDGGMNPVKMGAGAVLGGLIGGLAGPAFGFGTKVATYGAAAISAGLLSGTPKSTEESGGSSATTYNATSKSSSETYQIHEKANTWAVISFDKSAYLKARKAIAETNSTLAGSKSCTKQGIQFLDSVLADYRVMSSEDLNAFAEVINQLNLRNEEEAIKADKSGTVSAVSEKIDGFLAQRVRVIKLSWQDILDRSGNCTEDLAQDLTEQTKALYNDLAKTSAIVDVNSMAHIPLAAAVKAKSKALTAQQEKVLTGVQVRMMGNYVHALKNLNDLGAIEITKESKAGENRVVVRNTEEFNRLYEKAQKLQFFNGDQTVSYFIAGSAVVVGLKWIADVYEEGAERSVGMSGGASAASGVASSATLLVGKYKYKRTQEELKALETKMLRELNNDAVLQGNLNKMIEQVHVLFNLKDVPAGVISSYKHRVAVHAINTALVAEGQTVKANLGVNYVTHLMEAGVLNRQEVNDVAMIMELMRGNKIEARNADLASVSKFQAENLLQTLEVSMGLTKDSAQQAELEKIADNVRKEIRILSLLK